MASRREVIAGTFGMLAVAACEPKDEGAPTTPSDTDTDTDTDSDTDTDTDTDTDADSDADSDTDTGTPPVPCESNITDDEIVACLEEFPELATPGGSVTLESSRGTITIIRVDETTVSTVSNDCTHLGCPLAWRPASALLHCNCHGSEFAADGAVLQGPAGRPLDRWPTTLVGDTITIDLRR